MFNVTLRQKHFLLSFFKYFYNKIVFRIFIGLYLVTRSNEKHATFNL